MQAFCTIVMADYLPLALALYRSLSRFTEIHLEVLVAGPLPERAAFGIPAGMVITPLSGISDDSMVGAFTEKYRDQSDNLRWSLKSVWMRYLLAEKGYDRIVFVDADMFFFGDPTFLFDTLRHAAILLTPHWRSTDPELDPVNFELNFRDGLYNGGFIGAAQNGVPALEWLSRACLYACERSPERGLFVDQKYLDLLPVHFKAVQILQHRGCNVAAWNRVECRRQLVDGRLLINGIFPVVFVHFTGSTIRGILQGADPLLADYLIAYEETLRAVDPEFAARVITGPQEDSKGSVRRIQARLRSRLKRRSP